MLNYIWFGMIAASVICAAATGRLEALSTAIMNGAQQAVELSFFLLGSIYINIALHVDVQHVLKICLAVGMGAALLFWLLFQYHYGFYEHSFQTGWAAVCAAAVICDIIQLRRAERKGAAEVLL